MSDGRDASPYAAPPTATAPSPAGRAELLALALLTVLALALRLWRLDALPGGPHVDEAWNWIDARRVLAGWRPIFLPENAGREILYTYLQAALLGIFGDSLAVARSASAIAATAMVPLAWAVGRALAPRGIRRAWVGLPCAALAAGSYWSLHFGRFGIRAITFPLFVGGVALLWLRAVEAERRWWEERAARRARGAEENPEGGVAEARGSGPGSMGKRMHVALSRHRWALACGLVLGLAVYSHPAGRGLVVLPLAHAAWLLWRGWVERRGGRRGGRGPVLSSGEGATATEPTAEAWRPPLGPLRILGITALVALIVAGPVIGWWIAHPGFFLGHAGEVSVVGAGPGAVLANVGKALGMFNLAGDPARWRNLPGRPVFDALTGLLFLGGLALALRATLRGEPGPALALAWLLVLLTPTVLADQAPNFSRAIGILPVVYVFPALALGWLAGRILDVGGAGQRRPRRGRPSWAHLAAFALVAVVPLRAGEATVRDYFFDWGQHPETTAAFDDDLAYLGRLAGDRWQRGGTAYLSPALAAHPTIRVASPVYVPGIDTSRGIALLERANEGIALGLHLSLDRLDPSRELLSGLEHGLPWRAGIGEAFTMVDVSPLRPGVRGTHVRLDLSGLVTPASSEHFGTLELIHADARFTDLTDPLVVAVNLGWRATAPPKKSLTLTIRLVDGEGRTVAQRDGLPLGPGHPTDRWRRGEVVLLSEILPLDTELGAGEGPLDVLVGWYELDPQGGPDGGPSITDERTASGQTLIHATTADDTFRPTP